MSIEHASSLFHGYVNTSEHSFPNLIFAPSQAGVTVSGHQKQTRVGIEVSPEFLLGISYKTAYASTELRVTGTEKVAGSALFPTVGKTTRVELTERSSGLWLRHLPANGPIIGSATIQVDRVQSELMTLNIFDFAGVIDGARSEGIETEASRILIENEIKLPLTERVGLSLTQSYGADLSNDGLVHRAGTVGLGLHVNLGGNAQVSLVNIEPVSCGFIELTGSDFFGSFSGQGEPSVSNYNGSYDTQSGVASSGDGYGLRYSLNRSESSSGCWMMELSQRQHALLIGTGEIENILNTGNTLNSQLEAEFSGQSLGLGYMWSNPDRLGPYVSVSASLFVGEGEVIQIDQFGSVQDREVSQLEVILPSVGVSFGTRYPIGGVAYVFQELRTTRYDGGPFGYSVDGWEHRFQTGVGVQF